MPAHHQGDRLARVIFSGATVDSFTREMKDRVSDYFRSTGLSQKANAWVALKITLIFALTFGPYALILSGKVSPPGMLALAVIMGMGVAGMGFCVSHEALHGTLSARPWVNRILGWSLDLMGANGYMWDITHNVIHHTYTNIHGLDEDLEVSSLVRLSPQAAWKPYHRFQHLYGVWLYSLSTLNWVFVKDFKYFLRRDLGPYLNREHSPGAIAGLVAGKLVHYSWTIVIPLLILRLPWWEFVVGYLAMHLTAGTILGVVFQLAHVVEDTSHPKPSETGRIEQSWMAHEMATTANFAIGNRWLSWYLGGLNFQIEHHLFSKVCSRHYPALSRIVREVAARHGVPYNVHRTFLDAVRSHLKMLASLGRPISPTCGLPLRLGDPEVESPALGIGPAAGQL